jgi:ABC transporter with metal-binding/Fe-S-binding domain ATP-binding protein
LNIAVLFSAGKDSTFALFKVLKEGHRVPCIISIHPYNDESLLYHFPNSHLFKKISECLGIPIIERYCKSIAKEDEMDQLTSSINEAISKYSIKGVAHGTISSKFQLNIFKNICFNLKLELYSPLWNIDPNRYYNELFNSNFEILIIKVAALGLNNSWLGKIIDKTNYQKLKDLSKKYKFNITFEGGEAETMIIDCPLYNQKIKIVKSMKHWDGIRGTFEILDATLIRK